VQLQLRRLKSQEKVHQSSDWFSFPARNGDA
jgi:hypothetical protein